MNVIEEIGTTASPINGVGGCVIGSPKLPQNPNHQNSGNDSKRRPVAVECGLFVDAN
ncbi:LOW QUALITY PROTEIN: hypothetical protein TorRG33x02_241060 [Trema orientale]|uniref:Uncharacterized protein n=1 Tax=Trema orientale TaxID=63057 RepID=A0A2P5DV05_TREOI|nr:LOW QUALITY PROTEIN: hypothetical protein TorRG33x02_241060 [Trema orientale]